MKYSKRSIKELERLEAEKDVIISNRTSENVTESNIKLTSINIRIKNIKTKEETKLARASTKYKLLKDVKI